ncbi:Pyridoxal kinase [Rhodovulum sp. P5]|uniref:pyridoxal kinase n=1 Tax=Rhodovulum sp. P5 TaxID=1564506 RepID=UPI0009C3A11A|nr:pyridoxal kinase [Rhodovulum sp. P5]ARE38714.1 Pyridoxal kinase [Rhodovulum sp. P5]
MERVLVLSSEVAFGHVGLSAARPVLTALGVPVTGLPTVVLSNHPGWPHVSGMPVPVETLQAMVEALAANGWLHEHFALLIGYLPSAGHVALAADLAERLRQARPDARVVVDPVLGDAPKGLYVPREVAEAIRDRLVPLADVLTPNQFELGFLSGHDVRDLADAQAAADALLDTGQAGKVLLTSPPLGDGRTGIIAVTADGGTQFCTPLREDVPHGVGDAFAAMIAAGLEVGAALGHLDRLIGDSQGAPHLRIVETRHQWVAAPPVPAEPVTSRTEA